VTHKISEDDAVFFKAFTECEIDPETFHHREHIKLAYILLVENEVSEALTKLKTLLLKFLAFNGVEESKYHETVSLAWLLAVKHFMNLSKSASCFEEFIRDNGLLLDKEIMYTHYTREKLDSDKARIKFVEPDLEPIPGLENLAIQN
jgi:hypothetical protein